MSLTNAPPIADVKATKAFLAATIIARLCAYSDPLDSKEI